MSCRLLVVGAGVVLALVFGPTLASSAGTAATTTSEVDDAWPTHHADAASARSPIYTSYMQGCYAKFGKELCNKNEARRIALNRNQPAQQLRNFTSTGYAKVSAPSSSAFSNLQTLVETALDIDDNNDNGNDASTTTTMLLSQDWAPGNTLTNHWQVSNSVLLLNHPDATVLSVADRRQLLRDVQSQLERWSGASLIPVLEGGVRIYKSGSIVAPHVDRLPMVLSVLIHVARADTDSDNPSWPLQLIGHDGSPVDLVLAPGDMVLYESASVITGRPWPLQADYYADIVFHFEPVGYTLEMEQKLLRSEPKKRKRTAEEMFAAALAQQEAADSDDSTAANKATKRSVQTSSAATNDLPGYIEEYSGQAAQWRQQFEFYREEKHKKEKAHKKHKTSGVTKAHILAAHGDLEALRELVELNGASVLHEADSNGWLPIHEAARSGETETIEFLIEHGVDVNARTNKGNGGTPLFWASHMLPATHPAVKLLRKNGAVSIAPGD